MSNHRARVVVGSALATGAACLALTTPAFPMVSVSSQSPPASLDLGTQAVLLAKGVRVDVPVSFLCSPGSYGAYLYVSVNQRAGSVITSGYGNQQVACTGEMTTITVPVLADVNSRPFKKGTAAATAHLDISYGAVLRDDEVIRIR